jgi:hypothetical protein
MPSRTPGRGAGTSRRRFSSLILGFPAKQEG